MTEHLFEKLREHASEDIYPYHMPGHKRRSWGQLPEAFYKTDITEIEGFDNLHHPEGILLNLQRRAARIYGADESYYLVNGSTGGILSAVSSAIPADGHILMARNCHKSAYHGAYLRNLNMTYLYPPWLQEYDIFDAVTPQLVAEALEREPDINGVLVVSPTYEGRISDIGAIAEIVHKKGIPLIVDEAHGAHLGLSGNFPPNSCQLGADLVIHSVHKTLPALTQSALLHVNGNLVNRRLLERFLHIYQSSSPSYLLMASIDNALQYVEREGAEAFQRFRDMYVEMMETLEGCRHLKFLPQGAEQDIGKLFISVKGTNLTGKQLQENLLKNYGLQIEMASMSYVLAMFTINDGEEAYERMKNALLEIDGRLTKGETVPVSEQYDRGRMIRDGFDGISLAQAWDSAVEQVSIEESKDRYAGDFISIYPPGVPLVVPGEQITEEICRTIWEGVKHGLQVEGIFPEEHKNMAGEKIYLHVLRQGIKRPTPAH